jgi:uncharacterized glyoxalase superfamily protein PhnB
MRTAKPDGVIAHAGVEIGGAVIVIGEEVPAAAIQPARR